MSTSRGAGWSLVIGMCLLLKTFSTNGGLMFFSEGALRMTSFEVEGPKLFIDQSLNIVA